MDKSMEQVSKQIIERDNEIVKIFLWVQLELFKRGLWSNLKIDVITSKVSDNTMTITRNYFIALCREEFPIYKTKEATLSNILEFLNVQSLKQSKRNI